MGRKPKVPKEDNPNIVMDRVGEKTDLSLCPACPVYGTQPDCFACIDGRCTALKEADGKEADGTGAVETVEPVNDETGKSGAGTGGTGACSFYKDAESNMAEVRKCYRRLKDMGRSDLIEKYIKPLTALGLLDDEIEAAEQYGEEFDAFRERNYQEQLDKAIDSGLDDDLLDDAEDTDIDADSDDADDFDGIEDADETDDEEEEDDAGEWDDPCDDSGP